MTGVIAVQPKQQFLNNGEPVSGGSVTVYAANTTTPVNTWSDRAQTTLNANPIVLDAQGRCSIWLTQGDFYDFVIKDSLGATLYTVDDVTGALDSITSTSLSEWISPGNTPTFLSSTSFSLVGDQTATYSVGRRVRATISGGSMVYGTIIRSVFSSVTTVTLIMDSSSLDSGLSAVDVGIISYVAPSVNDAKTLDLSSYSGADISLSVGQAASYSFSSITSLPLRIATATNQEYELIINPNWVAASSTSTTSTTLDANNSPTAFNVQLHANYGNTVTGVQTSSESLGLTSFPIALAGAHIRHIDTIISTRTESKGVAVHNFNTATTTNRFVGVLNNNSNDTTTAWTSLGTLNFPIAHSGVVFVRRLY